MKKLGVYTVLITITLTFLVISSMRNIEPMVKTRRLKNVYGKPLKPCRRRTARNNSGSWDTEGLCSEMDGGVHQICFRVDESTKDFSRDTSQSSWSRGRVGHNHCMCLGAWALFKARQNLKEIPATSDELVCDAIPDTALSPAYVSKWNTWNGQKNNRFRKGIDALYKQCSRKAASAEDRAYLDSKYKYLLGYIVPATG